MAREQSKPTACIRFATDNLTGEYAGETIWAYDMGLDRYKVANLPFFIYDVSVHDIVLAPYDTASGFPSFKRVIIKSGNRTLRVAFDRQVNQGNQSDSILNKLLDMGCGAEGADSIYFAINVPPSVNLGSVVTFLERAGVDWEPGDPAPRVIP